METVYKLYNMLFTNCTRAEYDALGTYNDSVQYIVTETDGSLSLYLGDKSLVSGAEFTPEEKEKLEGIEPDAEVNVQADWNDNNASSDAYIKNKPNIFGGTNNTDIITPGIIDSLNRDITFQATPKSVEDTANYYNYTANDIDIFVENSSASGETLKYDFFLDRHLQSDDKSILYKLVSYNDPDGMREAGYVVDSSPWKKCFTTVENFVRSVGTYKNNLFTQVSCVPQYRLDVPKGTQTENTNLVYPYFRHSLIFNKFQIQSINYKYVYAAEIDIDDILRVEGIVNGTITPTFAEVSKYDLNQNGEVDEQDLLYLKYFVPNLVLNDSIQITSVVSSVNLLTDAQHKSVVPESVVATVSGVEYTDDGNGNIGSGTIDYATGILSGISFNAGDSVSYSYNFNYEIAYGNMVVTNAPFVEAYISQTFNIGAPRYSTADKLKSQESLILMVSTVLYYKTDHSQDYSSPRAFTVYTNTILDVNNLNIKNVDTSNLKLSGTAVKKIDTSISSNADNDSIPTSLAVKNYVSDGIASQSDWNENDISSPAYIKNKPNVYNDGINISGPINITNSYTFDNSDRTTYTQSDIDILYNYLTNHTTGANLLKYDFFKTNKYGWENYYLLLSLVSNWKKCTTQVRTYITTNSSEDRRCFSETTIAFVPRTVYTINGSQGNYSASPSDNDDNVQFTYYRNQAVIGLTGFYRSEAFSKYRGDYGAQDVTNIETILGGAPPTPDQLYRYDFNQDGVITQEDYDCLKFVLPINNTYSYTDPSGTEVGPFIQLLSQKTVKYGGFGSDSLIAVVGSHTPQADIIDRSVVAYYVLDNADTEMSTDRNFTLNINCLMDAKNLNIESVNTSNLKLGTNSVEKIATSISSSSTADDNISVPTVEAIKNYITNYIASLNT